MQLHTNTPIQTHHQVHTYARTQNTHTISGTLSHTHHTHSGSHSTASANKLTCTRYTEIPVHTYTRTTYPHSARDTPTHTLVHMPTLHSGSLSVQPVSQSEVFSHLLHMAPQRFYPTSLPQARTPGHICVVPPPPGGRLQQDASRSVCSGHSGQELKCSEEEPGASAPRLQERTALSPPPPRPPGALGPAS